ncbi:hypothetical protein LTS18_001628, partial [Coniosporium uncinatum]
PHSTNSTPGDAPPRSTRYTVVHNEMFDGTSKLADVTFELSCIHATPWLSPRSVPAAVYATKLAGRARCWLRGVETGEHSIGREALKGCQAIDKSSSRKTRKEQLEVVRKTAFEAIASDQELWPVTPDKPNPWNANLDDKMFYV